MKKASVHLLAVCKVCSRTWNISVFQQIPTSGYICPYCTIKKSKKVKTACKWLLLTIAGVVLFLLASQAAYMERGYRVYGGECFFLLLPIFYYLINATVNDFYRAIKVDLNSNAEGG